MDSNLPPETWITAAPQDTLTTRDDTGTIIPPQPGAIPFRYHIYWSGSDQDGAVAGFYWAVSETAGSVSGLPVPPLPGPKPRDYRYTTKTDSVFIFNVFEETNNREHAFYIYAVDEKGKTDATPARVIFRSIDRFPPIPIIEASSSATGKIFHPNDTWDGAAGTIPSQVETTIAIRDTFNRRTQVSDIVPMNSRIRFNWHSEITIADNPAVAYKYKIGEGEEVDFVRVPATVTSTEYNTTDRNRLGPGLKIFTLRAIDQAGGARTSPETTRRFYVNMLPDTWFSGPDLSQPIYTIERYGNPLTGPIKWRYIQAGQGGTANWTTPVPGSFMHPDSLKTMPSKRPFRKTFFEVYSSVNLSGNTAQNRHRLYAHAEGDTVHLNSWVLLHAGGFDPDSPYDVLVDQEQICRYFPPPCATLTSSPVLKVGPPNGSTIGSRIYIPVLIDSLGPPRAPGAGRVTAFPQSNVYPIAVSSAPPVPWIGGYLGMRNSGKAYAILRSQDGNGGIDNRILDPVAFVDSVDAGLIGVGHPRYPLRDKVITFYVNRAPYLLFDDAQFHPRLSGDSYPGRTVTLTLGKVNDDDPFQSTQGEIGGSMPGRSTRIIRYSVLFRGKKTNSTPERDTTFTPIELARKYLNVEHDFNVVIPDYIQGPNLTVEIEVCDCVDCENVPQSGRCRRYPPIPITILPVGAQEIGAAEAGLNTNPTGPGSTASSSRSRTP